MSLSENFNAHRGEVSKPHQRQEKRPAPFSLRLTPDERQRLEAEASGVPLGTYIKAKLLGDAPVRVRRSGRSVEDRQSLAQVLALLGKSRIANNLNQLAYAANIGSLPMTPETEDHLRNTLRDVRELRLVLLQALGLKEEGRA